MRFCGKTPADLLTEFPILASRRGAEAQRRTVDDMPVRRSEPPQEGGTNHFSGSPGPWNNLPFVQCNAVRSVHALGLAPAAT
jgi:hypothetical protein